MSTCKLPEILDIKDIKKNSIDKAYEIYMKEIGKNESLFFNGLQVKVTTDIDYNLKQQTFEHIVSIDNKARIYNLNRANKVTWIKHMIECCNSNCEKYSLINDRNNVFLIWCKDKNYLIVLELRKDKKNNNTPFYYLKTAYPLTKKDKIKQMYKKEKKQNENDKK